MRYGGKSQAKAATTIGAYYKHTTSILQPMRGAANAVKNKSRCFGSGNENGFDLFNCVSS
jgi:hypothetical protein